MTLSVIISTLAVISASNVTIKVIVVENASTDRTAQLPRQEVRESCPSLCATPAGREPLATAA